MAQMDASYARLSSSGPMFSHNIGGIGSLTVNNYTQPTEFKRTPAPRCPLASPKFIGRTTELEDMTRFFFGEGVLFDQLRILAVIGMGGCGKTQMVRKFMERVYPRFKGKPWLVFYVDATTTATLQASLVSIAKANGYGDASDAALAWMSSLDEPFFMYIDNADDPNINLRDYFPKSTHARIVITTRLRDTKQKYTTGPNAAIFLEPLSELEASSLLQSTAGFDCADSTTQRDLAELIQELHCYPLAIVQAGAAIARLQWTIGEYLVQFRKARTRFMDGRNDGVDSSSMDDYSSHVYTAWRLSYVRLSESTAKLLGLCAHLHHTSITEEMFRRAYEGLSVKSPFDLRNPYIPFTAEEPEALHFLDSFAAKGAWNELKFRQCIQEACSFSLLSYDRASSAYSIHPLIHDCLRSVAPHLSQAAFLLAATMAPIWRDEVLSQALVPHVQRILNAWPEWRASPSPLHPTLASGLGEILRWAGRWNEAQPLARSAVAGFRKHSTNDALESAEEKAWTLEVNHPEPIQALANLAGILFHLGYDEEAEKMCREVLEWRQRVLGMDHRDTFQALCNLASTVYAQGRYKEAEEMDREVLEWRQRVLGMDHRDTFQALCNLALSVRALGRYEEAEKMDREVLEWRQRVLGPDHPDTIQALSNLASTVYAQGRYKEAEEMEREVLEWRQRVLGPDHPDTIQALGNLASSVYALGRYEKAEKMENDVLKRRQRTLGPEHPGTIWTLAALGWTISHRGRYAEAEPLQRQALEMSTRVLGAAHPDTVQFRGYLEWTLARLREQTETTYTFSTAEDLVSAASVDISPGSPAATSERPSSLTRPPFDANTMIPFVPDSGPSPPPTDPNAGLNIAPTIPQKGKRRKALISKVLAPFRRSSPKPPSSTG